jgi:hypothetical protein
MLYSTIAENFQNNRNKKQVIIPKSNFRLLSSKSSNRSFGGDRNKSGGDKSLNGGSSVFRVFP